MKTREIALKKTKEMALKMLERNINIVDIMEVTGLAEEEILHLQNVDDDGKLPLWQLSFSSRPAIRNTYKIA